mmetsp:Transcript_18917/g.18586  ORF Transcript_18917/g.18586 Transcript_18917/m.18586 type:complete len:137 (+) Transcript_18917:799-1209(+)
MKEGDTETSSVIKDIIARYRANIMQDINDAQSLLVIITLKVFYLITGVHLVRDPANNSFLKNDNSIFKELTSKLRYTAQNQTLHNLSSKMSQNSDHLYSTDEASSSGTSFIESLPPLAPSSTKIAHQKAPKHLNST